MTIKAQDVDTGRQPLFLLLEARRSFEIGQIGDGICHLGHAAYVLSKGEHGLSDVYVSSLVNKVITAGILATNTSVE